MNEKQVDCRLVCRPRNYGVRVREASGRRRFGSVTVAMVVAFVAIMVMFAVGNQLYKVITRPKTAVLSELAGETVRSDVETQVLHGWGNTGQPRFGWTSEEAQAGLIGEEPEINSLCDGPFGNEKDFVSAKSRSDTRGVWTGDALSVKDGGEYIIRMLVVNSNPGTVSEGTRVAFVVPEGAAEELVIEGVVYSDNAKYPVSWDTVVLTAEQPFRLEYVGSLLETSGKLTREFPGDFLLEGRGLIARSSYAEVSGALIGYDGLDGRLPGGEKYAAYASITVRVVFEDTDDVEPETV